VDSESFSDVPSGAEVQVICSGEKISLRSNPSTIAVTILPAPTNASLGFMAI
jgi:hypothetical protein